MSKIVLIESSTSLCSVALAIDGRCVCSRQSSTPRAHASLTAPFVAEVLEEAGIKIKDCDAVALSAGPGSYTGLRVGSSTAKGLCFASGLPLIAVSTLEVLVRQAIDAGAAEGCSYIVPMIDARRMEVYSCVYSPTGERLSEIEAVIVEEGSFAQQLSQGKVLFVGDGADKCRSVLTGDNAAFMQIEPHASAMAALAQQAFEQKQFQNCAYFEPFYLKQFTPTVSKKNNMF